MKKLRTIMREKSRREGVHPSKKWVFAVIIVLIGFSVLLPFSAARASFVIENQLTGDPRVASPDGLIIDVTITVNSNVASWVVDINSPLHPNIKMGEFYFNLVDDDKFDSGNVVFTFPTLFSDWEVIRPATTQGGGNFTPNFQVEAQDDSGQPRQDVTNAISLTFDMTLRNGVFSESDFLNAPLSVSSDVVLGSGQMGAHLQSLTMLQPATSDSGFALGNYTAVPIPGAVWLLGSGLLGLIGFRRKFEKN